MQPLTFWQKLYIPEILRGMAVTTRHFVTNVFGRRHTVTQQYPEEPTYVSERYRGRHRLMRKEDGAPRCTACMLCATSCPALCIHIQAGEHPDATVEKYPTSFMIDELRCVFCGLCVEACPCDAIRMDTGVFALAAYKRENFLYPRNLLLGDDVPVDIAEGKAPHQEGKGTMEPTREIYGNIVGGELVYLAMVISFGLVGWALYRHYGLWMQGRPDNRVQDLWRRLKVMLVQGLGQQKTLREWPGLLHFCVYAGFIVLFIGTLMVAVHEDLGIHFLYGKFYLFYSLTLDVFGLLCMLGVAGLTYRRYVIRPTGLDNRREDLIILVWFLAVLGSGFVVEGLRIGGTELHQHPGWAVWSPVGAALAWVLDQLTMTQSQFLWWHRLWWWAHMLVTFGLLTYIGYSKLSHMIFSPLNILLHKTRAKGELAPIADLDKALEGDEEAMARVRFGAGKLADFTWKQLLDLDACTRCGRCQDNCPAWLSGKPLSPKFVILDLQRHMHATATDVLAGAEEPYGAVRMLGDVITDDVLWSCTTCRACEEHCPVSIEHVDAIIDMRRNLVLEQGRMPETAEAALRSMEQRGHPWRGTQATRTGWTEGLAVPLLADNLEAEYLFWVGCTGALVDRNIQVTKALVKILQAAGVSFAILGEEETCTGDPARRLGNEYLFQMLAQQNIETLKNYGVKKIITHCPHCFNTLKNEYPQFGGHFEVMHHSQLIARLLQDGRITPTQALRDRVTYHDACYLGRHNDVFAEPRQTLQAIPGLELQEMRWNQRKGLCCGAGGGHAFMEVNIGRRVNHIRTEQAMETGATVVATGCPFCMQMFEDGTKAKGVEERMRVQDIAELVARSLPDDTERGAG